jgi:hypothetical protein
MSCLLDRILLDIGHNHVGTSLGERGGNAEANAGSSTRYNGGLAGDVHARSLSGRFIGRHGTRKKPRL